MKKGMGKPMKKAQNGTVAKKKTYPIISEEGDLADALNEYETMKKKGTVPKTATGAMKQVDKWNSQGKLGPARSNVSKVATMPKKKMGGAVKKAQNGTAFAKLAPPYDKATYADKIAGATKGKAKMGKSVKKCKYGCK